MRKFLFFICSLILSISLIGYSFAPHLALAGMEFRRVINDNTPFFQSTTDQKPLFYLPYTYYVKVLSQAGEFVHIEIHGEDGIAALDGYTNKDILFSDGLEVLNPYLNLDITTVGTTVLYQDQDLAIPFQYVFAERSLSYYGQISTEQGKLFFVGYNNKLGYVKESDIFPFTIENHPNELSFLPPPPPIENQEQVEAPSEDKTDDMFGIKAVIILCLLFAGIIALFIALGKKSDAPKNASYYEENEFD